MKRRSDGRYCATFTIGIKDGKTIRKTIYGKTQKEVNKKAQEAKQLMVSGAVITEMTLDELIDYWLTNEKSRTALPQSIESMKNDLAPVQQFIGMRRIRTLNFADMDALRDHLLSVRTKAGYNRSAARLKSVLKYAQARRLIEANVAEVLTAVPHEQKQRRCLTDLEKARIFFADLNPDDEAYVYLLYYTGMRKGEVLALSRADIDLHNRRISVTKTIVRNRIQNHPKTKAGRRRIPIPQPLYDVLTEYTKGMAPDDLLFTYNGHVRTAANADYRWRLMMQTIFPEGTELTPHYFRHNYATEMRRAGLDVKQAQTLMGHDNIVTTLSVYTHVLDEEIDTAAIERHFDHIRCSQNVVNLADWMPRNRINT